MYSNGLRVVNYTYAGPQFGFQKPEETNNYFVVLGMENGSFEYGVSADRGRATFGDLVFTPPGIPFERVTNETVTFHMICFVVENNLPGQRPSIPVGKITISDVNRLASTYSYLRKFWPVRDLPSKAHLIADLLYLCDQEQRNAEQRKQQQSDPLMQLALKHIQQHIREQVSLQEIAAKIGISSSELTRRFRNTFGKTPVEYKLWTRMEEVKKLLRETNDTVETIAAYCGFESGSYLSRLFNAKVGLPPTEFRRKYQI